jgi:hypothetical protein
VKFEVVRDSVDVEITRKTTSKAYDGSTAYEFAKFHTLVDGYTDVAELTDVELGGEYTFFLGKDGKVVFIEVIDEDTTELYGVAVAEMKADASDLFGDPVWKIKIFTADEKSIIYTVEDAATTAAISANDLVNFEINKDGEITSITKAAVISDTQEYKARTNALGNTLLADDVVVFDVSKASDKDWKVVDLKDGDEVSSGKGFTNSKGKYAAISGTIEAGDVADIYFAVNDVFEALDSDDDPVYELVGFQDGVAKTALTVDQSVANVSLSAAPVVFKVDYKGDAIKTASAPDYAVTKGAVDAATSTYVKIGSTIYEVNEDVVVYVEVYDDGALDSYKVGSMRSVRSGCEVSFVVDAEDGDILLIVVTERRDVES